MASGSGADRVSAGMKHAFGKPEAWAARVSPGSVVVEVVVPKSVQVAYIRQIARVVSSKLGQKLSVERVEIKLVQESLRLQ